MRGISKGRALFLGQLGGSIINRLIHFAILIYGLTLSLVVPAQTVTKPVVDVYKNPSCSCCGHWAEHMEAAGFKVKVHMLNDVSPIRVKAGIPAELASCHTALVGGYAIEGHVPAADVRKLLALKPKARGLAVPGMPAAAPGMDTTGGGPYEVLLVSPTGSTTVFHAYP